MPEGGCERRSDGGRDGKREREGKGGREEEKKDEEEDGTTTKRSTHGQSGRVCVCVCVCVCVRASARARGWVAISRHPRPAKYSTEALASPWYTIRPWNVCECECVSV